MTLDGVRILWVDDYWDGPLAGVAEYKGRLYYFDTAWDPAADDWSTLRRFRLWWLTDEEIAAEQADHKEFEGLVSTQMRFHLPVEERAVRASNDQWASFYEAVDATDRTTYWAREPVGEFDHN